VPAPAPATSAAAPEAALGIMAGSGAGRKRKAHSAAAPSNHEEEALVKLMKKTNKTTIACLRAMASAVGGTAKGARKKQRYLTKEVFVPTWAVQQSGAQSVLTQIEATLAAIPEERLSAMDRATILARYQEDLKLALTPADDIWNECHAKAEAKKPTPQRSRSPKLNEHLKDEALRLLKGHEWNLMMAGGGSPKGTLTIEHLKALAIYKHRYSAAQTASGTKTPGKIHLLGVLLGADFSVDKAKAAEILAAGSDSD